MFVVFEGLDGCGKTTQARLLTTALRERGLPVVATREPGGTQAGEAIREIMFGDNAAPLRPLTWVFLMNGARAQLVEDVIEPALNGGAIVIADRYWYSTLAYQGGGDGVDQNLIRDQCFTATHGIEPDHVIYLDVPAETAMERKHGHRRDVLDSRPLDFHIRVAEAYRGLAREDPDRWHVVDGMMRPGALGNVIMNTLEPSLEALLLTTAT